MSFLVRLAYVCIVVLHITCADAEPSLDVRSPDLRVAGSRSNRQLLQQLGEDANCTSARPASAIEHPFCFTPDTISTNARTFLSTASAGLTPFGSSATVNTSDQQQLGALLRKSRDYCRQQNGPKHAAAVQRYLQSASNSSIGNVSVVVGVPKGAADAPNTDTKVLLYIHGGGYIFCSCQHMLNTVAATAAAANLTIICPEYSLASEHPFPTALNEVLTVYTTMISQDGYNPKNIVFLGDSAGGGMVAAVAVQLQREGVALPAALGMFSPWVDLTVRGDTVVTLNGVDPVLPGRDPSVKKPGMLLTQAGAYTRGNISQFADPLVSPVYADYAALFPAGVLPPTMIQVGLREVLLSDAVRLYHKMKQAAPAPRHVVLSPYEGMWHVFQSYIDVPEAEVASREMAEYFLRALDGSVCK